MATHATKSAAIRAKLSHPIIDSDGHTAEFEPALFDYMRNIAGNKVVERFKNAPDVPFQFQWYKLSPQERRDRRALRAHWWVHPTKNTLDRAASSLPKLLHARLDEMGLDYTIIYPSIGMAALHTSDEELRRVTCRALNTYHADIFREYADRMTPVAVIPMYTPQEAIEELEYVVKELKFKAILMAAQVRRPIKAVAAAPELNRYAFWLDSLGIDSEYDYDPVWAKCLELKVSPTFHSIGVGWGSRTSISNFMYNHIGHFAASAEAVCKSLFFGGVTRRFSQLRFAFLEGGVAWASTLFNDLVGHWEKHNVNFIENFDPVNLNEALMHELFSKYGAGALRADKLANLEDRSQLLWGSREETPADLDEWAQCQIEKKEDIRDLFVPRFFFGCEGDDRMTPLAFDGKKHAFRSRLNAIYGSDLGHFDLPDMRDAAAEAYELVEKEYMNEEDFRDFVFVNPVKHKTDVNPDFFKGTVVEGAVKKLLAESRG